MISVTTSARPTKKKTQREGHPFNLQQQLSIVFLASGQKSLPSFSWQQQAAISLPVSVHIRPDPDAPPVADPASSNNNTATDIKRIIV
jgi:hypothetical protein